MFLWSVSGGCEFGAVWFAAFTGSDFDCLCDIGGLSMSVPLLVLRCVLWPVFLLSCLRLSLRLPYPELVLEFTPATPTTCGSVLPGLQKL